MPDAGSRILGYLDVEDRRIVINEGFRDRYEQYPGSLEFTFAHEVGHQVLHVDASGYAQATLPLDLAIGRVLCRDEFYEPREVQANRFAAFLLLPEELLIPRTRDRDCRLVGVIRELAATFGVSRTTVRIRLERLGITPAP